MGVEPALIVIFVDKLHSLYCFPAPDTHSCSPNNQTFSGRLDNGDCDLIRLVDLENPGDLGQETGEETEVPTRDPEDAGDGLLVGDPSLGQIGTRWTPLLLQEPTDFLGGQRVELVDEADPGIELGVAGEALFETGHTDEHEADVADIEDGAELLQGGDLQTVGLVDEDEPRRVRPRFEGTRSRAEPFV